MTETPLPTPSPSSPGAPAVPDAAKVALGLRDGNLPIGSIVVATPTTDPGAELGRAGGYVGRAAFSDRRVPVSRAVGSVRAGGVVEVFTSPADARAGVRHASDVVAGEHDLVSGDVLLRLSPAMTAPEVTQYRAALQVVTGNNASPA